MVAAKMQFGRVGSTLRGWYAENARLLPWRENRSVYRTVVSEFMLQQTQVATVLPYFERWVVSFPDFDALAATSEEQVLKHWEGLGYYRRAKNIRLLAMQIVEQGKMPQTYDEWLALPGVGKYTAAAITSISFNEPQAVVDGNVVRVLTRLFGEQRVFKDGGDAVKHFMPYAQELLDPQFPGEYNEAIMELGATLCLRKGPRCGECPLHDLCASARKGIAESLPRFVARKTIQRSINRVWIESDECLLLYRGNASAQRLASVHELPEVPGLGIQINKTHTMLLRKKRAIANESIQESIYKRKLTAKLDRIIKADEAYIWVPFDEIEKITLSGPHKRWIAEVRGQ